MELEAGRDKWQRKKRKGYTGLGKKISKYFMEEKGNIDKALWGGGGKFNFTQHKKKHDE